MIQIILVSSRKMQTKIVRKKSEYETKQKPKRLVYKKLYEQNVDRVEAKINSIILYNFHLKKNNLVTKMVTKLLQKSTVISSKIAIMINPILFTNFQAPKKSYESPNFFTSFKNLARMAFVSRPFFILVSAKLIRLDCTAKTR